MTESSPSISLSPGADGRVARFAIDLQRDGRIVEWDPSAEALTGLSADAVTGQPLSRLSAGGPTWPDAVYQLLNDPDADRRTFEDWLWLPDGRRIYLTVGLEVRPDRRWVVLQDRTVRRLRDRQADAVYAVGRAALHANDTDELIHRTLVVVCGALDWETGVYWEVDAVDGVLRCRQGATSGGWSTCCDELTDGSVTLPLGQGLAGEVWKNGRTQSSLHDLHEHPVFSSGFRGRDLRTACAFPVLGRSGTLGVFEFASLAVETVDEDLKRTAAIIGNHVSQFSDRVSAEHALRESNAQKSAILSNALDGIIRVDGSGQIIEINEEAERTFRAEPGSMVGLGLEELTVNHDDVNLTAELRALAAMDTDTVGRRLAARMRRADDEEFPVELSISRIPLAGPAHFSICMRDLSEQERLQHILHHSQKMESLGRLASEISHDFNNFLTVIRGQAERLGRHLDDDDARRPWVKSILKVSERASALTGQLLAFGRREVGRVAVIDLNAMIESTAVLLAPQLGTAVTWKAALDPDTGSARVGEGQAQRILFNLALNARDAMPEGGLLRVETRGVDLDGDAARRLLLEPGPYVRLRVIDTGRGMDDRTQSRIFEPFFTTKELGEGTGLGLSTVYAIVKQCGGQVTVSSRLGEGTTFDVYLPRVVANQDRPDRGDGQAPHMLAGMTVLLVEDEDEIRSIVREILEERGCQVIEAPDGLTALDRCMEHDGAIDILLTDMMMPGMTGHELAEQVTRLRQDMPVMFVSGHPEAELGDHRLVGKRVSFLRKPFSSEELVQRVVQVVGGH